MHFPMQQLTFFWTIISLFAFATCLQPTDHVLSLATIKTLGHIVVDLHSGTITSGSNVIRCSTSLTSEMLHESSGISHLCYFVCWYLRIAIKNQGLLYFSSSEARIVFGIRWAQLSWSQPHNNNRPMDVAPRWSASHHLPAEPIHLECLRCKLIDWGCFIPIVEVHIEIFVFWFRRVAMQSTWVRPTKSRWQMGSFSGLNVGIIEGVSWRRKHGGEMDGLQDGWSRSITPFWGA